MDEEGGSVPPTFLTTRALTGQHVISPAGAAVIISILLVYPTYPSASSRNFLDRRCGLQEISI
jgi:hypothetical protein